MIVKLLTEHHLEFLSLIGSCRGSSESRLVKMSKFWKSHAQAQFIWTLYRAGTYVSLPQTMSCSRKVFKPILYLTITPLSVCGII